jgi:hypothetical protein
MIGAKQSVEKLLEFVESINSKYELSESVDDTYFEPGMMENLEQYKGEYNPDTNTIILRVESKGLRYDNRTQNLEYVSVGDEVEIVRESENLYNSNNFIIKNRRGSLGNLSAELCNILAPLYDSGYISILSSKVSYVEKIRERSRYAKQGVLFIELHIKLRVII